MSLVQLYRKARQAPFPPLGNRIGAFTLYDAYLMGFADRAVDGERFNASEIPEPDDKTVAVVDSLRGKSRNAAEEEFLAYFDLLRALRAALVDEASAPPGR